jgi:hypothetical protein
MPEVSRQAMTSCSRCGHSFEADSLGASTWIEDDRRGQLIRSTLWVSNLCIEMMYLILLYLVLQKAGTPKSRNWFSPEFFQLGFPDFSELGTALIHILFP